MEFETYFRFVAALALVLALIAVLAWGLKRYSVQGRIARRAGPGTRLSVIEFKSLDARRKLVLVRRDDVEHLILLGPNQELLVEAGITAHKTTDITDSDIPDVVSLKSAVRSLRGSKEAD